MRMRPSTLRKEDSGIMQHDIQKAFIMKKKLRNYTFFGFSQLVFIIYNYSIYIPDCYN